MKKKLLYLICSFTILLSASNIADRKITFYANWEKGESKNFIYDKTVKRYQQEQLFMEYNIRSNIKIDVTDVTDSNIFVAWNYSDFVFPSELDFIAKEITNSFTEVEFQFKLSDVGEFEELINWEEVQKTFTSKIDSLEKALPNPEYEQAIQMYKKTVSTKSSLESFILKDIKLFYKAYGIYIGFDDRIEGKVNYPNFLGGNPFEAFTTTYLSQIEESQNFCILKSDVEVDTETLAELMKKQSDIEDFEENFHIEDNFAFNFNTITGWMNSIYLKKTQDIAKIKKTEEISFLLVK